MKLYGTTTSPFVRRVRIVAAELGVPLELVNTATDDGQAALRTLTPIWKVPTAVIDGRILWDSRVIVEYLLERHGAGPLRMACGADRWRELNLVNAIDGALDASINAFYFERDGMAPDAAPYLVKQRDRVDAALAWIAGELEGSYFTGDHRLGPSEIALVTALDWMVFRDRYPVDGVPVLAAFRRAHADRPSLRATYPVA